MERSASISSRREIYEIEVSPKVAQGVSCVWPLRGLHLF